MKYTNTQTGQLSFAAIIILAIKYDNGAMLKVVEKDGRKKIDFSGYILAQSGAFHELMLAEAYNDGEYLINFIMDNINEKEN